MEKRILFKEAVVFVLTQLLILGPNHAFFWKKSNSVDKTRDVEKIVTYSDADLLKFSHISYRATGGFTGVKSYSVLITCIDGKISVLNSIHDPKARTENSAFRKKSTMEKADYLALWEDLRKQRVFNIPSAPNPHLDIMDEFTFQFDIQVADHAHQFEIYGLSRPEGARYFAVKSLIDKAGNMASLWDQHQNLARK